MSFLFPRRVSIGRLATSYTQANGLQQKFANFLTQVHASIQIKRDKGFGAPAGFPAATNSDSPMPLIEIMLRVKLGQVRPSDVITDELGTQYKIDILEWTPLGSMAMCSLYKPGS